MNTLKILTIIMKKVRNISFKIRLQLCIFKASNEHANCVVTTTEKLILDDYFLNKYKPKTIARKYKISKVKVYWVIRETKKSLLKYNQREVQNDWKKRAISSSVFESIQEFWSKHMNKYFLISDVMNFLAEKHNDDEVPSYSTVLLFMKKKLKMSYKRVSSRPLKISNKEFIVNRLEYIKAINIAQKVGFRLIQIDEFTVSNSCFP